jgi:hypothetical protein
VHVAVLSAVITWSVPAWSDGASDAQVEAAESLFKDGAEFVLKEDWPRAIAKFKASLVAKPTVGAHLNLGRVYEQTNELVAAHDQYEAAARLAKLKGDKREIDAADAAKRLESLLGRITLTISPSSATGLAITVDGAPLDPPAVSGALAGKPIWVVPGEHVIAVSADGTPPIKVRASTRAAEATALAVPLQATQPLGSQGSERAHADRPDSGSSHLLTWTGYAVGGVGVVATAVGSILGGVAIGKKNDLYAKRDGHSYATDADYDAAKSSLRSTATASTVLLIAGGTLAAGGITLLLLSPKTSPASSSAQVRIGPSAKGLGGEIGMTF